MPVGFKESVSDAGEVKTPEFLQRDMAELPDDSGETPCRAELPDDSGETPHRAELSNVSGEMPRQTEQPEKELEEILQDYFKDLKESSECPETIPDKPFDAGDLEKRTPEENAKAREEFSDEKERLKREWEEVNGKPWPKYEHDVYSANGKLIRKAGSDYDAHHIQPLGMGGKNEVSNITPLNAEVHYDKQGIHAPDSPYSKLDQKLGGTQS